MDVDQKLVGKVIGKGGETIKQIQAASGAKVDIDQQFPDGQPRKARSRPGARAPARAGLRAGAREGRLGARAGRRST
jgi:far upstream element-binding protein